MDLASKLFRGDRVIWIIFMFLCLISVVEVFSASSTLTYKNANHWGPIVRHSTFLLMGFAAILVLHNVPYRFFSLFIVLLPVSIGLLILTPFIGVSANHAHRWLEFMGFQFQPSEFAKLALIVFIAFILSKRKRFSEDQIFKAVLIAAGITCLLILPENFSTALMLFGICYMLMFVGQVPLMKLFKLGAFLVVMGGVFFLLLLYTPPEISKYLPDRFGTWQARMERFWDKPATENLADIASYRITDSNYQEAHAKIAIARGGVFGKMPGHSQQRDFLPQAYSDFIYAIIIEELGIVGGLGVLLLYVMLLIRVGMIARRCEKAFPKYLVLGCGLAIVVQAFANMAVAVDLIPVTGQPLPLISRGGTSTVITCVYVGIILSVSRFGAGMGEDEEELAEEEAIVNGETAFSGKELETVLASVEVETIEEANL